MVHEAHDYGDPRVIDTEPRPRPPAMGWLWGLIGIGLLAWLAALILVGDDDAGAAGAAAGPAVIDGSATSQDGDVVVDPNAGG